MNNETRHFLPPFGATYQVVKNKLGTYTAIECGTELPFQFESAEAADHGAHVDTERIAGLVSNNSQKVITLSEMIALTGGYGGGN